MLAEQQFNGKPVTEVVLPLDNDPDRYVSKHYDTYEELQKKFDYVRMENLTNGHVAFVCYDYPKAQA